MAGAKLTVGTQFDRKGIDQAQRALQKFADESKSGMDKFKDSVKAAGDRVRDLGGQAVDAGDKLNRAFLGGVGAAVVGAGLSIKAFADFDQKMVESQAIMGDLTDQMKTEMGDAAREVGRTTKFGAGEAAEAFYFLASAGLDAATSIEALPQMAAFAQAGNFDMARATDILTDAQSALGLSSDDTAESMENMSRVSDVFVRAATLANTSVEQLGTAFTTKAGAAVNAAGMEFEGAAAALAVFADSGVKGGAAGTMLTAVISNLQKNSRDNADAFEELGVSVWDSRGNMLSMEEIVSDMEIAFAGLTIEERNAALAQLGLNRQALDGINLLYGNAEAMSEYRQELMQAGGTTDEVANKQMDTFNARLGLLKDRLIDAAIGIGQNLMPHVEKLFDVLEQKIIPAVTEFAQQWLPVLREKFDEAREAIEPVVRVLADHLFQIVTKVVDWMKNNMGTVKVFFAVLAGGAVILMLVALAAKIAALFNPITLIIGGLALLVAAFYHAWQNSETFRDVMTTVFEAIREIITRVMDVVRPVIQGLVDTFQGVVRLIRGLVNGDFKEVLGGLKDIFLGVISTVVAQFLALPRLLLGALRTGLSKIGGALKNFGRGIVRRIIDGIKGAVGGIGSAILGAIPGAGAIGGLISGVKNILPFADGGLVTGPTIGLVGEAGPELVIPLDQVGSIGGGGGTVNVYVQGSVISENDLIDTVRRGLVSAQLAGARLVV